MDWGNFFTGIGTGLAGLAGGYWARRSAKDTNIAAIEANARELYSGLSTTQTAELIRLSQRVEALDRYRDESERERTESRRRNRAHMAWDRDLVGELRTALPSRNFPDPPPLDT